MDYCQLIGQRIRAGNTSSDGVMVLDTDETLSDDGRRERSIRALGEMLNALVSQSRALTGQAAVTFHAELQPAAFHIALWLNAFGPAKPSAVAQAVGMDRSAASRLTRDLLRLGLIEACTDPSDRRSIVLSLTVEGHRRIEAAMHAKGATFRQRVASWSEEELLLCTDLLRRLIDGP
jgi:DNA-binding MarR family transcriptional regulator